MADTRDRLLLDCGHRIKPSEHRWVEQAPAQRLACTQKCLDRLEGVKRTYKD